MASPDKPGKDGEAIFRIGTRGSPLALAQAEETRARLAAFHPALRAPGAIAIVTIKTTGDRVQDRALAEIGGKGLFTKEIEEALLAGAIDLAVHSMKDLPNFLPRGLGIGCLLPREDPRDVLVAGASHAIADLPRNAIVGTASLRRQSQLLAQRKDLEIVTLRGNVGTRLEKVARGEIDATVLALAGLKRLGKEGAASAILSMEEMLPAAGQGAIGVETRLDDERAQALLSPINDKATAIALAAERACLAELEGSCRTPIAAYAELVSGRLRLRALVALPDGSALHRAQDDSTPEDAERLGQEIGRRLKAMAGPSFLS